MWRLSIQCWWLFQIYFFPFTFPFHTKEEYIRLYCHHLGKLMLLLEYTIYTRGFFNIHTFIQITNERMKWWWSWVLFSDYFVNERSLCSHVVETRGYPTFPHPGSDISTRLSYFVGKIRTKVIADDMVRHEFSLSFIGQKSSE